MDLLETIKQINEHIAVLNDDYTKLNELYNKLSIDVAVLKNQMSTIMWWFKAVAVAFIGVIVTQIWQIIVIGKNNKRNNLKK